MINKRKIKRVIKKINPYYTSLEHKISENSKEIQRVEKLIYTSSQNILNHLYRIKSVEKKHSIILKTSKKIAVDSLDHILPRGTINDNTQKIRFVESCEKYLGRKCSYLDLGCAGGGLVKNFLELDNFSIGIEGSDICFKEKKAEWARIPTHLFTADISKKFTCLDSKTSDNFLFDIIGAWEVLEHIHESSHDQLFNNIASHLKSNGFFVASISVINVIHHVCVKNERWWLDRFKKFGFKILDVYDIFNENDLPRGINKGKSFHVALSKDI